MTGDVMESIAGVMGNVLEWYDFALFGFFSDVIAEKFFPPQEGHSALLQSFAIFGGAFLMRPIGGLAIGYMGDKHGRKTALTFSLFLMGVPTFVMGCLPSYETAGAWSIFALALARLLQGMSVGGQLPASLVYTVETKPREKWGLYGSFVMMAANVGTLLGNLVGALLRDVLTDEQLRSWGWRIPFLSGILIAFVGMYLKTYGTEHHPNEGMYDHQDSQMSNPIKESFRKDNRLSLLACALTPMLWASGFYLTFVWMAIFMDVLVDPPVPNAFWVNLVTLFFGLTIFLPIMGHLSDKIGRVKVMATGSILMGVLGPVLVQFIASGDPVKAGLSQWVCGIFLSMYGGPICAWMVENFNPEVRLTSASLGYDVAHALAGGFSPAWATLLVERNGNPGFIYTFFAVVSLTGVFMMRRNLEKDMRETPGEPKGGEAEMASNGNGGSDFDFDDPEGELALNDGTVEEGGEDEEGEGHNLRPIT